MQNLSLPLQTLYSKLTAALAELVDDFGIVGFMPLAVEVWAGRLSCFFAARRSCRCADFDRLQRRPRKANANKNDKQHASVPTLRQPPPKNEQDKAALQAVLAAADKASGALYATLEDPRVPLPPEFVYGAAHRCVFCFFFVLAFAPVLRVLPVACTPVETSLKT
jgi:hypothetical protein